MKHDIIRWRSHSIHHPDSSVILQTNYGYNNWKYYEIRKVAKDSYSLTYCDDIVWDGKTRHVLKDDFPIYASIDAAKKGAQLHWNEICKSLM